MYKAFFSIISSCLFVASIAQTDLNRYAFSDYNQVKLIENGDSLINAWAGGMNYTQFNTIDLNGDNIEDLVIFDRTGNRLMPFVVEQINGVKRYKFKPEYESDFPNIQHWMLLIDYNCDGEKDLFTAASSGVGVYKNNGNLQFQWALPGKNLSTDYGSGIQQNLYVSKLDLPAIVDVDGDGDLDIFTFGQGNTVQHHEGQTNCGIDFKLKFWCWGGFEEDAFTNTVRLDECNGLTPPPPPSTGLPSESANKTAHSGSTLLLIDLNGNNLYDAIIGDVSFSNAVAVFNDGTPDSAHMYMQDTLYPSYNTPVNLTYYPGFYYEDVDFDGVKDLVSTTSTQGSENYNNTWFYKNTNTTANPTFSFTDSAIVQKQMIEMGEGARPVLVDFNYDQTLDLFVCNSGFFNPSGNYKSVVYYYKNTGTTSNPEYTLQDRDFADLSTYNFGKDLHITMADMDGDADLDMFVGNIDGNIHYFENQGLLPNHNYVLTKPLFQGIDVGANATPFLFDVDDDGHKDLLIGNEMGSIYYYKNDGGSALSFTLVTTQFGGIDTRSIFTNLGYSVPYMFRDKGKMVLMVGSYDKGILQYDSIDHVLNLPTTLTGSIGTDTISTKDHLLTPFGTSKKAGRNQVLYKASELQALGLEYGKITNISLNVLGISNPLLAYDGLNIGMKLVNEDSLTSFHQNTSQVYYSITVPSTGWLNIPLQFPFTWDGTSDLLIEYCFSKQFSNVKDIKVELSDAGFTCHVYGDGSGSDNQTKGCNLVKAGTSTLRPNIKFILEPTFVEVGAVENEGIRNAPAMGYLDDDSYPELLLGNFSGGVRYFKGEEYQFPNISVREEEKEKNIKIYPNPANQYFKIAWEEKQHEEFEVLVYSLNGQLVIKKEANSGVQISTQNLESGLYVVQVVSDGQFVASEKLIILND